MSKKVEVNSCLRHSKYGRLQLDVNNQPMISVRLATFYMQLRNEDLSVSSEELIHTTLNYYNWSIPKGRVTQIMTRYSLSHLSYLEIDLHLTSRLLKKG